MIVNKYIKNLQERLAEEKSRTAKVIAFLKAHANAIEEIGICPSHVITNMLDFDHPTREQVLKIIKLFPGDWEKAQNTSGNPAMDYIKKGENGQPSLRIWAGELPPSCRIVEETVEVPAHTATIRKIVCKGKDASSAMAALSQPEPAAVEN